MSATSAATVSALLCALLLTACGGGDPEPDEAAAEQPVQVIGDKAIPTAPSASASK